MPFEKGHKKLGGRLKGSQNKLTRTVKEVVLETFNELQHDSKVNLLSWAKDEPTEFYKIASKLIQTEVKAEIGLTVTKLPDWLKEKPDGSTA